MVLIKTGDKGGIGVKNGENSINFGGLRFTEVVESG